LYAEGCAGFAAVYIIYRYGCRRGRVYNNIICALQTVARSSDIIVTIKENKEIGSEERDY